MLSWLAVGASPREGRRGSIRVTTFHGLRSQAHCGSALGPRSTFKLALIGGLPLTYPPQPTLVTCHKVEVVPQRHRCRGVVDSAITMDSVQRNGPQPLSSAYHHVRHHVAKLCCVIPAVPSHMSVTYIFMSATSSFFDKRADEVRKVSFFHPPLVRLLVCAHQTRLAESFRTHYLDSSFDYHSAVDSTFLEL